MILLHGSTILVLSCYVKYCNQARVTLGCAGKQAQTNRSVIETVRKDSLLDHQECV